MTFRLLSLVIYQGLFKIFELKYRSTTYYRVSRLGGKQLTDFNQTKKTPALGNHMPVSQSFFKIFVRIRVTTRRAKAVGHMTFKHCNISTQTIFLLLNVMYELHHRHKANPPLSTFTHRNITKKMVTINFPYIE